MISFEDIKPNVIIAYDPFGRKPIYYYKIISLQDIQQGADLSNKSVRNYLTYSFLEKKERIIRVSELDFPHTFIVSDKDITLKYIDE